MTEIKQCKHFWAHEHWVGLSGLEQDDPRRKPASLYSMWPSCCGEMITKKQWN